MHSYLILKFDNYDETKLVQKLQRININIYDIKQVNADIYVKIRLEDYKKITKYLKTLEFHKYKYFGLAYLKQNIKKYYLLLIGFITSVLFIFASSFFIVDIDIIHEDESLVELIKDELDKYGVKKFSLKKSYEELQEIKKNIKNDHLDKIDWLEINKVGMKYVVRIEQRIITTTKNKQEYCNIFAKKDGLIRKIKVFTGEAVININDYVKKDDLLISGDIKRNEEIVNQVCANGEIYAEVWYTINIQIPLEHYENKLTGRQRKNIIINYNDIDYKLFKDRLKNYKSNKKLIFNLLGIKIYDQIDQEVEKVKKTYTKDEAINEAIKLAKNKVNLKLGKNDFIINEKVLQNKTIDSTMDIDIFIVAEEQIGYSVIMKKEALNNDI